MKYHSFIFLFLVWTAGSFPTQASSHNCSESLVDIRASLGIIRQPTQPKQGPKGRVFRIVVTSDLHVPITSLNTVTQMVREISRLDPDVLVVAGDVAESPNDFDSVLAELVRPGHPVLVLAGNHDVWARNASSQELWENILPEIAKKRGVHWLESSAFRIGNVAVTGSIGWYDYSALATRLKHCEPLLRRNKRRFIRDGEFVNWRWSDEEFSKMVSDSLMKVLTSLEMDPSVRTVAVMSHVALDESQMYRFPNDDGRELMNAYFGNLTLGSKVLKYSKVRFVVSGHSHFWQKTPILRRDGSMVTTFMNGSDYGRPDYLLLEIEQGE